MMKKALFAVGIILGVFAVTFEGQIQINSADMSNAATLYLNQTLDLMQAYTLYRKQIDWPRIRTQAFVEAKNAQSTEDTYPAIVLACTQLKKYLPGCLLEPQGTPVEILQRMRTVEQGARKGVLARRLTTMKPSPFLGRREISLTLFMHAGKKYAYLVVPFDSKNRAEYGNRQLRHRGAEALYGLVAKGSLQSPQGWIIDLRGGDTGGSVEQMLAGLSSLFDNGKVLTFRNPKAKHTTLLKDGTVLERSGSADPYVEEKIDEGAGLSQKDLPVAVLIDRDTQGSSQLLAIAFRGRRNTYLIGERTFGSPEYGVLFPLADGAFLALATEEVMDEQGRLYSEGVEPDRYVEDPAAMTIPTKDPGVLAAEEWFALRREKDNLRNEQERAHPTS